MNVQDNVDPEPEPEPIPPLKKNSKSSPWVIISIGIISLVCVAAVLCVSVMGVFSGIAFSSRLDAFSPPLPLKKDTPPSNQIAFVGNDNNIWLVSPNGEDLRSVTTNGDANHGYRFPTWSPNNERLAFVGPDDNRVPSLYLSSPSSLTSTIIYNAPNSVPFYLYWSPNSLDIAFLSQDAAGMSMRLVEATMPENERILERGAPFYWVWSPQGDRVFMHVGGARAFSDAAHLSILENEQNANRIELVGRGTLAVWSWK